MQSKQNFLPFFLIFFSLSIVIFLLGRSGLLDGLSSLINGSTNAVRENINKTKSDSFKKDTIEQLTLQNKKLVLENKALKDQFNLSGSRSLKLIPAHVIGAPGFIPGLSLPDYLIIDKGTKDGINKEDTIIVGDYLVGKIVKSFSMTSKIQLITSTHSVFTVKIADADISGVIKGKGNGEMILDNVVLSKTLAKGGKVLTKGNKNENNEGYPPDLIVGEIISVDKKSSELFQKASVRSPLDFSNFNLVFVLK